MGPAWLVTSSAGEVTVIEVDRPNRQKRRRHGKSDQLDAVEAARGALSGRCEGQAKSGTGYAEALRALLVVKRSARSTRIRTIVQLRHLMFTAPDELRARFAGLSAAHLVIEAAKLRPRPGGDVGLAGHQDRSDDVGPPCASPRCRARRARRTDRTVGQSSCASSC